MSLSHSQSARFRRVVSAAGMLGAIVAGAAGFMAHRLDEARTGPNPAAQEDL